MAISSVLPDSIQRGARAGKRAARAWLRRAGIGVAAFAVAGVVAYGWLPRRVAVEVGTARFAPLAVEVDEDGQTRVRDRFVVASPITGTLERIAVEPGAVVHAGEVIARVAPPASGLLDERSRETASAQLAAATARQRAADIAVARARVARDAARREAARTRTLDERGAIAATERERADDQEQLAEGDLAAATAQQATLAAEVAAARATLGLGASHPTARSIGVVSPADGRVLRVVRDSAGPVTAGAVLIEIGDPRALEVVIDVLSSDAARVTAGMAVAIEAWGGDRALAGTVRQIEPSAFTRISALGVEEQRVKVIAEIPDPPATLGDGFRVEARIFTWRGEHVLTVPASAVFRDRDRWAVYAIEDGRAHLRPIVLGHRGRLEVEVLAGVAPTAEVILHPADQIVDGTTVRSVRAL